MKTNKKLAILASAFVFVAGMSVGMNINKIAPGASMTISADDAVFEGFKYVLKDGEVTITGYTEELNLSDVIIPDEIEGNPVTKIGDNAFASSKIVSLKVSDSVTTIGNYAFAYCYSLKTLDLGKNVISIGDCCLASQYSSSKTMNISNLTLPDNLKAIGNSIFSSDQNNLFSAYTNISNIYIPASVTNISSTFYTISSVQSINVEEGSKTYLSDQGILYSADKSKLIRCPASTKLKTYTVLDGTQTISNYAFTSTSLSEITVSDTVTSIGNYAFSYCYSLKTLDLGRNVTSIGDCCLASQYSSSKTMNISNLTLPDNLKAIGNSIFSSDQDNLFSAYTNISNIYIPASVTNIPSTFYTISSVQSINVEKGNKTYFSDQGVLYLADKSKLIRCPASTTLKTYTVLDETKIISDYAFTNTSLTDITVSDSVTSIGSYAFAYCYSLKTLDLGRNVTSIGDRFIASGNTYTMSIDELTIPDNLEVSDFTIFYTDDNNWSILYQINVPASATNISPIFYRRASVKSINVEAKNKNYSSIDGILYNANQTELIKCPASNPALVYEIPNTVTYIWNSAFNQTNIQNILIPASVTKIGESVFTNSALKTIEGYTGSLAETYANENKYKFVSLGDAPNVPSTPDEPSDPGTDEPSDPGTDKPSEPNEEQEPFYDVNRDGKINIMDLAKLKTHLLLG